MTERRTYLRGVDPDGYAKLSMQPEEFAKYIKEEDSRKAFLEDVAIQPLKWWTPNGAQEEYIRAVAKMGEEEKIGVVLSTFANGVGKTTATINILLNIILGAQNGWFDHALFTERWWRPKLCWYISTAEALSSTVIPMIQSFLKSRNFLLLIS